MVYNIDEDDGEEGILVDIQCLVEEIKVIMVDEKDDKILDFVENGQF